jgi:hypothetical protein
MKYTVIGLEETEGQGITEWIEATDPYMAMKVFSQARASAETTIIVDVIEGEHLSAIPDIPATYCADVLDDGGIKS